MWSLYCLYDKLWKTWNDLYIVLKTKLKNPPSPKEMSYKTLNVKS